MSNDIIDTANLIFDNIPIGILSFNSKHQCSYANKYMYDLFDVNTLTQQNINFCELFKQSIHKDYLKKELDICDNFLLNLKKKESISKIYNKQRSKYHYFLIKRIFIKQIKEHLHYIYIFQDIDEKKRLQLKLQTENATLNKNNSDLSLILKMSHQIRTPLNGIIGMLSLLEDTNLSVNQQDYISMVKECSFNLITVINDILDFTKLQNNEIKLNIERVNIQECLNDINDIISPKIYEKGLKYNFNISNEIPYYIITDPNRLKQILLNLLINSIKFTNKGNVSLNINLIPLTSYLSLKDQYCLDILDNNNNNDNNNDNDNDNDNIYIRFDIIDTGCGIDRTNYNKLFKSFNQFNYSPLSQNYDSTGLGLQICKSLLKLMNGFIWLDKSSINQGSTFSFIIPNNNSNIEQKQISNFNNINNNSIDILKDLNVLILDDNLQNRISLTGMVTKFGMKAYSFSNCEEALCYTKLYNFDIGLIDICMPEMNGINFAIKLKEQKNSFNNNIPLIALSSFDYIDNNDYFKTFLLKPIKEKQLQNICINIMSFIKNPIQNNSQSIQNNSQSISIDNYKINNHLKIHIDEYYKDQIKILIVEDNQVNLKILIKFIQKLGYNNIITAENGQICLDLFLKNDFDIIFMDIKMPIMDGDIALQKILEYENNNHNKPKPFIVSISAYSQKQDKDKYLLLGFNDYITKPINIIDLETTFNNFFSNSLL